MPFGILQNGALVAELGEGDIAIGWGLDDHGRAWVAFHIIEERDDPGVDLLPDRAGQMVFGVIARKPSDFDVVETMVAAARARLASGAASKSAARPIPMVLHCPDCGEQHVDAPDPAIGWDNPPHKTHLCLECGALWRPADVPTEGVKELRRAPKAGDGGADRTRNTMSVHGPSRCPRSCIECSDGEHHFSEGGICDENVSPHHPAAQEGRVAWVRCKHCPAWIDYDDYAEAMGEP